MEQKANAIFYGLSGFLLMTALFVIQPSQVSEVSLLQNEMVQDFSTALHQTIGDQPFFSDVGTVIDGVAAFYDESASATIALFEPQDRDQDIVYVYKTVFNIFAEVFTTPHGEVAGVETVNISLDKFMTEPAILNIIPGDHVTRNNEHVTEEIAGMSTQYSTPVNTDQPWVTLRDNFTGQTYCIALYNGEVNKYLGPCKYDYH
jgi:hypothetical protein